MAKKQTYAGMMDTMSKKLQTYETKLQDAQNRGDSIGIQDYGRRVQRIKAGMESLFQEQEASKKPQMSMGGMIKQYGPGGLTQAEYAEYKEINSMLPQSRTPEMNARFADLAKLVESAQAMGWQEDFGFNPDGSMAGRPMAGAEVMGTPTDPGIPADVMAPNYGASITPRGALVNAGMEIPAATTPLGPPELRVTQDPRRVPVGQQEGAINRQLSAEDVTSQGTTGPLNQSTNVGQTPGVEVTGPLVRNTTPPTVGDIIDMDAVETAEATDPTTTGTATGTSTGTATTGFITPEVEESIATIQEGLATQRSQEDAAAGTEDAGTEDTGTEDGEGQTNTNQNDVLGNFFNSLQGKQDPIKQYAQFLPDIAAAIQMERSEAPADLPMPVMARMNTNVNMNPILARAQQDLANRNAMLAANISDPVLRAAMMQDAANQVQDRFGEATNQELTREQALENEQAQRIAQFRTQQGVIGAQNKQRQIDFRNDQRATRAKLLQQAGAKFGQIQQENALRELQGKQLGISALAYEGDMIQRMAERYPALEALITGRS